MIKESMVCVGCFEIVPPKFQEVESGVVYCNICGDELCTKNGEEDNFGMLTRGEKNEP